MKILALDTTTFLGAIALVEDDRLVAGIQHGTAATYSERLIAGIDYCRAAAGWTMDELDLIAVAQGPGSFTGLRIGLATAKGLAVAGKVPLKGVSSLEVLAYGVRDAVRTIVPVIDARRDEVYAAAYAAGDGSFEMPLMEVGVFPPVDLCRRLEAVAGELMLVGDGARRYREVVLQHLGARAHIPDDAHHFPHGLSVAALARAAYLTQGADDVVHLVPNYIRHSDAEIGFNNNRRSPLDARRS